MPGLPLFKKTPFLSKKITANVTTFSKNQKKKRKKEGFQNKSRT
mgnify:CR=1 FL=1